MNNLEAIQIETGIPMPKITRTDAPWKTHPNSRSVRLYELMKVGDSILFSNRKSAHTFLAAIITLIGRGRLCSRTNGNGSCRVWRVE